jgi:hypothetical protein
MEKSAFTTGVAGSGAVAGLSFFQPPIAAAAIKNAMKLFFFIFFFILHGLFFLPDEPGDSACMSLFFCEFQHSPIFQLQKIHA